MAFGFSPKYEEELKIGEMPRYKSYSVAVESAKALNWKISLVSGSGFIAYTKFSMSSWSEEVQVKFEEDTIKLKSECAGSQVIDWGKNKKNVTRFIDKFNELKGTMSGQEAISKFGELEKQFVQDEDDTLNLPPLSKKEQLKDVTSLFIPTRDYFITPIILLLNLLVFILMVANGVGIMEPDTDSLLAWGANYRAYTLDGEWWRLFTSCFIHIGIFHLFVNMYALMYIGVMLEPLIGKTRFLTAYLLTGLVGSAFSIYWNSLSVSAGASGAIFGMYGLFLSMLTTKLIEKSARQALLTSIGIFVAYNLMAGMQDNVDNAAHIGGLLSGLLIGYAYYPGLMKRDSRILKYGVTGLLSVLLIVVTSFILLNTSNDIVSFDKEMNKFIELEKRALKVYDMLETEGAYTKEEILVNLRDSGVYHWEENIKVLEGIEKMDIPEEYLARNVLLKEYCELRIKLYELIYKMYEEDTDVYMPQLEGYNNQIRELLSRLNGEDE